MLRSTLLATGAAVLCCASVASADSIVYLDQGNVWTAQPDGTGKVQLTDGGGWHSPTQADDGTIAAVANTNEIVVMAKDGREIRRITTKEAKSSNGGVFAPVPKQLSFSPDGTKIAYAYVEALCPPASSCGAQNSVFYTHVDGTEATPIETYGNQFSVRNPEWVTNDRALVFGGYTKHVNLDDLGGGNYSYVNWFTDADTDIGDGELSRDGTRFAALYNYGSNTQLRFWSVTGDARTGAPPAEPAVACGSTEPDEAYADPSWSPDSKSLAFTSKAGIETITLPTVGPNTCTSGGPSKVVFPGASSPDWGPSEPATARYKPDPTTVYPHPHLPPPADNGTQKPPVTTVPLAIGAKAKQKLGGLRVTCTVATAGRCSAVASVRAGGRTWKTRKAKGAATAGQPLAMVLRFDAKATRALRKALRRSGKLRAKVVVTSGAVAAEQTVTLTR